MIRLIAHIIDTPANRPLIDAYLPDAAKLAAIALMDFLDKTAATGNQVLTWEIHIKEPKRNWRIVELIDFLNVEWLPAAPLLSEAETSALNPPPPTRE